MPRAAPSPAPTSRLARAAGPALAILALAAAVALRLWSAWNARFSAEEASFWNTAVGIARAEAFPALGHSVSGTRALHPGPLFFWVIALSQLVVASPFVGNAFVSMLGLLGALLMARTFPADGLPAQGAPSPLAAPFLRVAGSRGGALFFLLVLASPWWVIYSNSTWPSYVVTGTAACFVAALWRVASTDRSRAIGPLAFILIAGFQIHLSLLHLWPLTAAVLLVSPRRRFNVRWLLGGALVAVACYTPYVVSELRTHFANTRLLLAKSQGGPRQARALLDLYLYFLGFATTDISFLWQHGFWTPFEPVAFWSGPGVRQTSGFFRSIGAPAFLWGMHVLSWLTRGGALVVGAARMARAWRRGARRPGPAAVVYLTALADIAVFYLLSGKGGFAHYVGVLLPIAFIPTAMLLAWGARTRLGRAAVGLYLAGFMLAGLLVMRGYYRVDSRLSAPQTDRVVGFILAHARDADGRLQPVSLRFGFSPAWVYPYQVLARRLHHQPLTVAPSAPRRFLIGPRDPAAPPAPPDPRRLDLRTIFVDGFVEGSVGGP